MRNGTPSLWAERLLGAWVGEWGAPDLDFRVAENSGNCEIRVCKVGEREKPGQVREVRGSPARSGNGAWSHQVSDRQSGVLNVKGKRCQKSTEVGLWSLTQHSAPIKHSSHGPRTTGPERADLVETFRPSFEPGPTAH